MEPRADLIIAGCPEQAAAKVRIGRRARWRTDRCDENERERAWQRGMREGRGRGMICCEQRRVLARVTIDFVSFELTARVDFITSPTRPTMRPCSALLQCAHAKSHARCNRQSWGSRRAALAMWDKVYSKYRAIDEIIPKIGVLFD